jgi:hypothetical protein
MAKFTIPIPKDEIKESFVWRDWFQRLSDRVYGSLASQNANNVAITGGNVSGSTIDNTIIGSNIPSTGSFTSLKLMTPLAIAYGGTGVKTATAKYVFAGPISGSNAAPTFRALVTSDIPSLTSGTSLLYGNGSGGFSNVSTGSGVSFVAGVLSATGSGGTITSVTATAPIASSGGFTPNISINAAYGDTVNPYAAKTANYVLAGPTSGAATAPTFRALVAADIPSLSYVTSVSGTSPVVSSGGTTPAISMAAATASVSGYLTSTDWTTFNNKQPAGAYLTAVTSDAPLTGAGTSASHLSIPAASASVNGYLTSTDWNTFNNKGSGTVTSVTGTTPVVSSGGTTPAISMPAATTSVSGYLTSTDWNTFNGKGSGTVTSVTGTAPIASSGGATPAISLAASYGDTQNPYASKTANYVLAAPNGVAGVPTFRAVVAADIPTLNQNTTGTAANITATSNSTLTTLSSLSLPGSQVSGNISGNAANVTGVVGATNGGTGQSTVTTGDLLYGSATNTWSKLGIGSTGQVLRVVSGLPAWGTDYVGTVTSVAATVPSFLSISGSPITSSGTLAIGLSGTALPTTSGGTGLTSFTANGVVYASSTSALATGSAFVFDGTNVGIGTSSPQRKLHSYGGASDNCILATSLAGNAYIGFADVGTTDQTGLSVRMGSSGNGMVFQTGGTTERMRIDSSGNVGIGTNASYGRFAVVPASTPTTVAGANQIQIGESSSNTAYRLQIGYLNNGANGFNGSIQSYDNGGASNLLLNATGGNVGIGTSSPSASAILDAQSTTKGVRMPNMTTTQKNAISSPATGLMVFDTTLSKLCVYSGAAWQTITSV